MRVRGVGFCKASAKLLRFFFSVFKNFSYCMGRKFQHHLAVCTFSMNFWRNLKITFSTPRSFFLFHCKYLELLYFTLSFVIFTSATQTRGSFGSFSHLKFEFLS